MNRDSSSTTLATAFLLAVGCLAGCGSDEDGTSATPDSGGTADAGVDAVADTAAPDVVDDGSTGETSADSGSPLDMVGNSDPPGSVETTPLLDFSLDHPLHDDLSNDNGTNDVWTHLSRAVYGFIAPGTRTYVTIGHSGGHATGVCYKCTPTGATEACGGYCANDVSDYDHTYWLWDVADMVDVLQGNRNPWEMQPYEYGVFPTPFETRALGGGAYDADSGLLYLTVQKADRDQGTYSNPPVIVAYRLD